MGRLRYIAIRTVQTVFLLWLLLTFLFFMFRLMPGSFLDVMAGVGASPETVEALREKWGLNDPLYIQYWRYLVNFAQLDVGTSLQYRVPVWTYVKMKIFNTLILVAPAITFSYIVGAGLGTWMGTHRGSAEEKYGIIPVIMAGTTPEFFIAIILIVVFATGVIFNWFPTGGLMDPETMSLYNGSPWWRPYLTSDFLKHYVLPFTAVTFRYVYIPTLIMRTSVVETSSLNFTYYHRVTGIPALNQLVHVAKHSILPVFTHYPVSMTRALSGLVLIEVVFNWPGIGFALVSGVLARDFAVVQFVFFISGAFVIIANFVVDVVYGIIDPRISVGE